MSYTSWHNYGYGICTDLIPESDAARLQDLLALAPEFRTKVMDWLADQGITAPTWDDYMAYDQDYYLGVATLLKAVIEEAEGLTLTACDDHNGAAYLMYQPSYPWQIGDADRDLTEERLRAIFARYVSILTDQEISIEYLEAENGG